MMTKVCILALGILASTALCEAEDVCPWINAATVIDAPGSSVRSVQSIVAGGGDTCVFHYQKADGFYSVEIAIRTATGSNRDMAAPETRCTSDKITLTGIGNGAVLCGIGAHGEQVIGRVRDKIFTINVDVKTEHHSTEMTKSLSDRAIMMAAQVAGNLF